MQKYFSLALNQNDITARTINLSTKTVRNLNCIDDVIYYKSELGDNINVRNYGLVSERIFPDDIDTYCNMFEKINNGKKILQQDLESGLIKIKIIPGSNLILLLLKRKMESRKYFYLQQMI